MPTVRDICDFMEKIAPGDLSEKWDNTGLLLGRLNNDVQHIMTCLTLTPNVAEEAIRKNVDLIVTHHPIMFSAIRKITDNNPDGKTLLSLTENRIAVFSPHTSFDNAASGINQQLAEALKLSDIQAICPDPTNRFPGAGRIGQRPKSCNLKDFLQEVAVITGARHLEFTGDGNAMVFKVGIACGAGGDFFTEAINQNCDTFVTGESKFHTAISAVNHGVKLINLGHFFSEQPAVKKLAVSLQQAFPSVIAHISEDEYNPLTLFTP